MIKPPRIPMLPEALPQQGSGDATQLPPRPAGFVGHCEWYEPMPAEAQPKGSPRSVEFLGSAEWADSPGHTRLDSYYLNRRGRYWLLWNRFLDESGWSMRWRWELYGWGLRKGVNEDQAAVYLLMDAWRAECDHGRSRFEWISGPGQLSSAELNAIADQAW